MTRMKVTLPLFAGLALAFGASSVGASELVNLKPLVKDAIASNPGMEVIVPVIEEFDDNADFYPDRITVKFRVYAAGTLQKLLTTPQRRFNPPANPCQNPSFTDWDWEADFIGEDNISTGISLVFEVECSESGGGFEEGYGTFVYVANTGTTGSGWAKTWSREAAAFDLVDWDDDGTLEVMVVLAHEVGNTETLRYVFLRKGNGVVESDRSYTAVKTFND